MITNIIIPFEKTTDLNFDAGQIKNSNKNELDVISYAKIECVVYDDELNDIDESFFDDKINNDKMCIIVININPNSLDMNSEESIRYWLIDSKKILNDNTIDDETKLKYISSQNLQIYIGKELYNLINCKIIEDYSDERFPYYFAILIDKITSQK